MPKYIITGVGKGTYNTSNPLVSSNLYEIGNTYVNNTDGAAPTVDGHGVAKVFLDNFEGRNYGFGGTPLADLSYSVDSLAPKVVGGFQRMLINCTQEPTVYLSDGVTAANKLSCSSFQPNFDMELIVESPDGVRVDYYFLFR